jgi:phosphoenolpyruvate carboxykinase (GTP)
VPGSPQSQICVEITDSPFVVASLRQMTHMGQIALDQLGESGSFLPGLHTRGDLNPDKRCVCHFPEERLIVSYGSDYGAGAILRKECVGLRMASIITRDQNQMVAHMRISELQSPAGDSTFFAEAFPTASGGPDNFLPVVPPPLAAEGWKWLSVGENMAWMNIGEDGRLWATNPESGLHGSVAGVSTATCPNVIAGIQQKTLFTNVAVTENGEPWWEGKGTDPGEWLIDWKGIRRRFVDKAGGSFAHPDARYTAPAANFPGLSTHRLDAQGVPISAILFAGQRSTLTPLVTQSLSWNHGIFYGATMVNENTDAANVAPAGPIHRDPMGMQPFCGHNLADYFRRWLEMGVKLGKKAPPIFQVNWFRRDETTGAYLWPGAGELGAGENVRALIWMRERIAGRADAHLTALGDVPTPGALPMQGLDTTPDDIARLLHVDVSAWKLEASDIDDYLNTFGERLPKALRDELRALDIRLISRWLNGGLTEGDLTVTGACGRTLTERRATDGRLMLRVEPSGPGGSAGSAASPCTRCRRDCVGDLFALLSHNQ